MDRAASRWNIACHFLDGTFFFAALTTFSVEMVIPEMITELGGSAFLLGLVPLILQVGLLLPQAFYAKSVEGLAYKKPRVLLCALLQRVGWIVFLASLFVGWAPAFTLPVFFVVLMANSVGSGLIVPVWTDWYAKTVPEGMWARVLGMRRTVPALLGIPLGRVIGLVMERYPAPARYKLLAASAIAFYALSLLCVALVREERHDGLPNQRGTTWRDYLRGLTAIVFRRRDFRLFVLGSLLVTLPITIMATFLTRWGLTYPGIEAGITGTFTMFYFGLIAPGAFVGGILSDRGGTIAPFRLFPLCVAAGAALAAFSPSPVVVSVAWGLVGFGFGARMVVMLPAVLRYAGPHRRPSYTAASFITLGVANGLVPPLLGVAKDAGVLSFPGVFMLAAALGIAGWLIFLRMPSPEKADG
ncbi:MAG: hypothetical protein AMK73_08715 [Planctomycetes bacterium SM23_32]|nr:MAG: hypothetical protein AMK73_08715 [Planctomycetes bacterium SM23_32]